MRATKETDAALDKCVQAFAVFNESREALAEARRRFREAVEAEFGPKKELAARVRTVAAESTSIINNDDGAKISCSRQNRKSPHAVAISQSTRDDDNGPPRCDL